MPLFFIFARRYPQRTLSVLLCLLLAALAEGIGLSSLLPLLGLATKSHPDLPGTVTPGASRLERFVVTLLGSVGLQPTIEVLFLTIIGGMTLKAGLVLLAQQQVGYAVAHVATDLRLALVRALFAARWEYYIRQPLGALTNAFATEAARAAQAYLYSATIVMLVIESLLYTFLAVIVSWQATIGALVVGVVIVYALHHLVRISRRAGARQTVLLKAVLGRLTDVFSAVKPLKAMAREATSGLLIEGETQLLNRAFQREILSKEMLRALQEPLVVISLAGGLYLALTRWALPLERVIVLAVLFGQFFSSLNKVQKQYQMLVSYESAFWSLQNTIDHAEREHEVLRGQTPPTLRQAVYFGHVSFSYDHTLVLHDVSFRIPVGQVTALTGPSGAGKTSIADLIIGLVQPQAGTIWIDRVPLSEVNLRGWRQMVGYVSQEAFLLHESISRNVSLGEPEMSPADIESALKAAGAWEFISALPEGMETMVGEHGARFSGGQRQRIAIARALVHKPQLLILDEATAALDPESEAAVCETVKALRGKMTLFVISHRPALLEVADYVYRLERGQVQLLASTPFSTRAVS